MKQLAKNWWKSKTLWASLGTVITGLGLYFNGEKELQELMIATLGAIFAILRVITTKPLK